MDRQVGGGGKRDKDKTHSLGKRHPLDLSYKMQTCLSALALPLVPTLTDTFFFWIVKSIHI